MRHLGAKTFEVFSCGAPASLASQADTTALTVLTNAGFKVTNLAPKDWGDFSRPGAKPMDIVISLDETTKEREPVWPGQPETALWEFAPLEKRKGESEGERAIRTIQTLHSLHRRIELLISLRNKVTHHSELRHDIRDMAHL